MPRFHCVGSDWVVKLHRRGKLQGLYNPDNLERVSELRPRLARRRGYTGLMDGSGIGELADWA
jgi:hypothetical protein